MIAVGGHAGGALLDLWRGCTVAVATVSSMPWLSHLFDPDRKHSCPLAGEAGGLHSAVPVDWVEAGRTGETGEPSGFGTAAPEGVRRVLGSERSFAGGGEADAVFPASTTDGRIAEALC
ncbi:hypothetical protein GCM10018782_61380 [Streptomyces griseoaurantiacus]|nr:hypothetical protein GCM10018782_61380 [Streptomyces griseoaurantiacus]